MAASGDPMGATITGPRVSSPKTCAGRGAVNVTIASARAIPSPDCAVIASESAPDGMSTATTGLPPRVIAAIPSAYSPFTGGLNPVPRMASTSRSQFPRLRDDSACNSVTVCTMIGRTGSRSNIVAASPFSSDGAASSSTSTTRPARCNRRAATKPSPPLLPLPHTMAMRSALLKFSKMNCATAVPAFSIKVSEGTPNFSVVTRSISRISAAVVIFTRAPRLTLPASSGLQDRPLQSGDRRHESLHPAED